MPKVSIEPKTLDFPFDNINQNGNDEFTITKRIKVRNTGFEKTRFDYQYIEKQPQFELIPCKSPAVFPGKYEELIIRFRPDSWDIIKLTIYVKDNDADLYPVTITGKIRVYLKHFLPC